MSDSIYQPHDHSRCIQHALASAKALCQQRGVRLTPIRQRVLELVWQSHKPMGAYDLLPTLADEGFNSAPPTVYRALDFLLELGLVHRLASLNAYIGCTQPEVHSAESGDAEGASMFFLICQSCGLAEEIHRTEEWLDLMQQLSAAHKFKIQQSMTEISGICSQCQSTQSQGRDNNIHE